MSQLKERVESTTASGRTSFDQNVLDRVELMGETFLEEMRAFILSAKKNAYSIETKADNSVVTEIDLAVERKLRESITANFPDHGIIGEEFSSHQPESEYQWIIDPIDGTEEFARGFPFYGSILALHYKGSAIWAAIDHPELSLRYSASRGRGARCNGQPINAAAQASVTEDEHVRLAITSKTNFRRVHDDSKFFDLVSDTLPNFRVFRSCYAHTSVVGRNMDVGIEAKVKLWDLAATELLVSESGLRYQELEVGADKEGSAIYTAVYGEAHLVEKVLSLFKEYRSKVPVSSL